MLRLLEPPPPAAAELVPLPALVPVPDAAEEEVAADEVAADVVPPPAAAELELEPPPHAATPSASAAALRSRAGCLNMTQTPYVSLSTGTRRNSVESRLGPVRARTPLTSFPSPSAGLLGC